MNWEQLSELESLGISIGGHTLTHACLSTLSSKEQMREVEQCTKLLENNLGHPIESFVTPTAQHWITQAIAFCACNVLDIAMKFRIDMVRFSLQARFESC